jgi:hypothetical protein
MHKRRSPKPLQPTWQPGDPIPPLQTRVDFAAVYRHRYGPPVTVRSIEAMAGIVIVRLPGDKRALVDTRATLAYLDARIKNAPRHKQSGRKVAA